MVGAPPEGGTSRADAAREATMREKGRPREEGMMMANERFTLIDDGREVTVTVALDDPKVFLAPDTLDTALGWELTEEGLCREGLCVPWRADATPGPDGIDLGDLARTLDRPLALDVAE